MAVRAFDGFDHYGGEIDMLARAESYLQWQTASVNFVAGRNGGKAVNPTNIAFQLTGVFAERRREVGVGHATTFQDLFDITLSLGDTVAGVTQVKAVFHVADRSVSIYRNATLLLTTAPGQFEFNAWCYVELWASIDPAAGYVLLMIDGQIIADLVDVDTQASANAWADNYTVQGEGVVIDDFYVCDGDVGPGSDPCNFPLGDVRVITTYAIGTDAAQWAPLADQNWQQVSDLAMDSDATYNSTLTPGAEDRFNFTAVQHVVTRIVAVQVTGAYRKADATQRVVEQVLKSALTEAVGPAYSLPDTAYSYFTDLYPLDPASASSWTLNGVNGLAAGYRLVS